MLKTCGFLAVSAVLFFPGAARAGGDTPLAMNRSSGTVISVGMSELKAPATAQARVRPPESTDFDALSTVNDPLYREGSKEFLEQVSKQDTAAQAVKPAKAEYRDAVRSGARMPVKAPAALKKPAAKKPVHSDPVRLKNTL